MLQCLRKATAQLKIITKKTQHLSLPLQKCSLASKQYSTDLFRQYFSTSFSTSVACHVEHVIGPWKSSPAKRPGITSHYCARMQNSGDDYRSSRIFNSCPGPEGLGRSNNQFYVGLTSTGWSLSVVLKVIIFLFESSKTSYDPPSPPCKMVKTLMTPYSHT